ncbi:MAG: ATP synthase F1 subunit epsilon [bacterium]|nr:ATP synthase F1 subunit epsilon [bacterium]
MADSTGARVINLSIVTPSSLLYEGEVSAVQVPLHDGLMGVLPGHAPLIGLLGFGPLTLTSGGARRVFAIDGGFVEVTPSRVTVLANGGEDMEQVDQAEAQKSLEEALASTADGETRMRRREEQIAAARTRLKHGSSEVR